MAKDRVDLVKGSNDDFGGGFSSEESRDRYVGDFGNIIVRGEKSSEAYYQEAIEREKHWLNSELKWEGEVYGKR